MKRHQTALVSVVVSAIILFFSLQTSVSYSADDDSNRYPHLVIASIQGRLDASSPSTLAVVLHNNATGHTIDLREAGGLDRDPASAISIIAELVSEDNRIHVLSEPQMIGSLHPGENATVEFMALAEGAEVGIHSARLGLNYSRLQRVSISGEDIAPDITFVYEKMSVELPLPVKVVLGPIIEIKEVKGTARPGEISNLKAIVANNGDETAFGLQLEARIIPPFLQVREELERSDELIQKESEDENGPEGPGSTPGSREKMNLLAGSTASFDLAVLTEANATPGYAPLPCSISYLISPPSEGGMAEQGSKRMEDIALLVMVKDDWYLKTWMLLPAGLLIVLIIVASYLYFQRNRPGKSGRNRRPRKSLLG